MATDPLLRFARLFEESPETECYEWQGRVQTHSQKPQCGGYPVFRVKEGEAWKTVYAHRWILEQVMGRQIAQGCEAGHRCNNRCCVNPTHLEEVTKAANIAEANRRRWHAVQS